MRGLKRRDVAYFVFWELMTKTFLIAPIVQTVLFELLDVCSVIFHHYLFMQVTASLEPCQSSISKFLYGCYFVYRHYTDPVIQTVAIRTNSRVL
jgi:hypothetical protein